MSNVEKFVIAAAAATSVPATLAIELNAGCSLHPALAGAITIGMATAEIIRRIVGGPPARGQEA